MAFRDACVGVQSSPARDGASQRLAKLFAPDTLWRDQLCRCADERSHMYMHGTARCRKL